MRRPPAIAAIPATLLLAALAAAGCGTTSPAAGKSATVCTPAGLPTLHHGLLTIGVDDPLYAPWFVGNNNPESHKGFEDTVAFAVAHQLGYANSKIRFTRVQFNQAIQPGPKPFDFDIDEFSITAQRKHFVDFSAPYYNVAQAIVALKSSKIVKAHTLAALRGFKFGAQVGTTSYNAIVDQIKPTQSVSVYNSTNDAKAALEDGQIDAIVTDLPTAFYIASAQIPNSTVIGQLPQTGGKPQQFGLLLDKGSPLTACVSKAVNALRANGMLARLQQVWLSQVVRAPVLQ